LIIPYYFRISFYEKIYVRPMTRSAAWIIGTWLGIFIAKEKQQGRQLNLTKVTFIGANICLKN